VIWARGFRPFFLLAGAWAVIGTGLWLAMLWGLVQAPGWAAPSMWHAHEMLFGFAAAAVAGFLLTSVPVWTGQPSVTGARLAALALLWLGGRLAVGFAALLPLRWLPVVVDVAFPLTVAAAIGGPIYRARSERNYGFPAILVALAGASLLMHLAALGIGSGLGRAGATLGVGTFVLLVAILGARLIPLFTGNAAKRAGLELEIRRVGWADRASAPLLVAFFVAYAIRPGSAVAGGLAVAAAVTLAVRARGWGLRAALRDPLLWSMHAAWAWLPIGLAALGASALGVPIPSSVALHALTIGCIGGMILAIMSRVALGHTGRPFVAPGGMALAYVLVHSAAAVRVVLPVLRPEAAVPSWLASGALWLTAFSIFLVVYAPMLVRPRLDGAAG
jgi:uncharacterized protein involved in response to NO